MVGVRRPMLSMAVRRQLSSSADFRSRLSARTGHPTDSLIETLRNKMKRQSLKFRGAMIRRRIVTLPFSNKKFVYSFSDLSGHGAFIFLACSYLETDFANLRIFAASGIVLSIIFQYYREKPLWLPIKYGTIGTNSALIVLPTDFYFLFVQVECILPHIQYLAIGAASQRI